MNNLERWLERIQGADHKTKKLIMWIGVPVIMAVIIFLWLTYSDFGYKEKPAGAPAAESPSNLEILKNGFDVSIKEFQSFFQDIKEKIRQTNSFDVTVPENNQTGTTSVQM